MDSSVVEMLSVGRYVRRGNEVEVFVASDDEFIELMKFVEKVRERVAEFVVERPSLEESYMEVLRLGESP